MELEDIEKMFNEAIELAKKGREKDAITLMGRCMRLLERYIQSAVGAKRVRAIMLLRNIGKMHTELSNKTFHVEPDHE